ncbi:MAG: 3'-5' exonuclease [Deinococcota bacterium]|nr:3'-5' exonuclease [Deinococcota bacterium]
MNLPWSSPAWRELTFWALDLETGGLRAKSDPVLSVGMVPVRHEAVRLGEAYYSLLRPKRAVAEASLKVHHILPQEVAQAPLLAEVLPEIDKRLREGVLLVHHAPLDVAFLRVAYRKHGRPWPRPKVVDTLRLLLRLGRRQRYYLSGENGVPTNLLEARLHFGLPSHPEHHALEDAVATAELFLLLAQKLEAQSLRDLS